MIGVTSIGLWQCRFTNTTASIRPGPSAPDGRAHFNDECIGPRRETINARPYDSLTSQIGRNGDAARRLVVKIDVEGAEIESLMSTSDEVLQRFDQLAIELHGADQTNLELVRKLRRTFLVAHLHFNNSRCAKRWKPFPSPVYEVLFVNKAVGKEAPHLPRPVLPHALDGRNDLYHDDCQAILPVGP